jgi:hypothetical protein
MWRRSLAQDLTEVAQAAAAGEESSTPPHRLAVLEHEHRLLSVRRRRLHESIDLLEGFETVKPDAAARLESYKINERAVSRRRREVYRELGELRVEEPWLGDAS